MQFELVAMLDAMSGKWYGILLGQIKGRPTKILDQTDPIYPSRKECMDDMEKMLKEAVGSIGK